MLRVIGKGGEVGKSWGLSRVEILIVGCDIMTYKKYIFGHSDCQNTFLIFSVPGYSSPNLDIS